MTELGYLRSDSHFSEALAISADGSTIVGWSYSTLNPYGEAFRWTQEHGMVGFGVLFTIDIESKALAVSGNGSVVIGTSRTPYITDAYDPNHYTELDYSAFVWDENHRMENLRDVLVDQYGVDLSGWHLIEATGISDDGRVLVGNGMNSEGRFEGWIARLPSSPEKLTGIPD